MKQFLKFVLGVFFFLFTIFILLYTAILSLFNQQIIRDIHEAIPPLATIGYFLGTFDYSYKYNTSYQEKKHIGMKLQKFLLWKQNKNVDNISGHQLILDDQRKLIQLYSPIRTFQGKVSDDIESLDILYIHSGRNIEKHYKISLGKNIGNNIDWKYNVSLGKENLFNGKNIYIIKARFLDGTILNTKVVLYIDYERIEIGDIILYIDPTYIPDGESEDILREAENFDNEMVNFISYGCDPEKHAPHLLSRQNHQYRSLPACISFSISDEYLLWFRYKSIGNNNYYFDIISANKGMLYYSYPLLEQGLNTLYYNFVYRDKVHNLLKFLEAKGDTLQYAINIKYYDIAHKKEILSISHTNGNQLLVENSKEKIFIYLYKEWSNYHSLIYPGLRYIFYYKGIQTNEGPLYILPFRLLGPAKEYASTFDFKIKLDDFFLYIDDRIKTISFDTRAIGQTIEVQESKHYHPLTCDQVYIDIYKNKAGRSIKNIDIHDRDTLRLVGEGIYASEIKIFHNGKRLDNLKQYYKGWFYISLSKKDGNLQKGRNIYIIKTYDKKGKEICSFEKYIEVKEY